MSKQPPEQGMTDQELYEFMGDAPLKTQKAPLKIKNAPKTELSLFPTEEALLSRKSAGEVLESICQTEKLDFTRETRELAKICSIYWVHVARDEARTFASDKSEWIKVEKALAVIEGMSDTLKVRIESEIYALGYELSAPLKFLLSEITLVRRAADKVFPKDLKGKKGRPIATKYAAKCLCEMRERLTNETFNRNLEPKYGDSGTTDGFQKADAEFVRILMQAIDKKLTYSQVHTALERVFEADPKKRR